MASNLKPSPLRPLFVPSFVLVSFQALQLSTMDEMDIMAAIGISGFGKKPKQRQLDPKRFEKNKRDEAVSGVWGEVFLCCTQSIF